MRWLTRRALESPRAVLALTAALTVFAAAGLPRIPTEVGYRGVLGDRHPSVLELDGFIERFGGGLPVFAVYGCEQAGCESVFDEKPLRMAESVEAAMAQHPLVRRVESPASSPILVPAPGGFGVRRLVEAGRIAADREALRERALADPLWEGTLVSRDGRVGAIVVQLASSDSRTTSSVVPALREALAPFEADGFRFHLVGDPVDFAVAGGELQRETPRIVPLMVALIAAIVYALLRSWRMTLIALVTTGLAVLWAIGAMGWLGWPQSELTQALAPAVLVIGVCGAIHVLARFASLVAVEPGADRGELLVRVAQEIGVASLICALTTVAGFLSFSTSDFASFLRFGAIASIGVVAALALSFSLLPVLLLRAPPETGGHDDRLAGAWDRALQLVVRLAERRAAAILGVAGILLFVCGIGLARLEVDVDERELLGSNSEVVRWAEFVEANLRRSDTLEIEISAPEGASVLEPEAMGVVERVAERLPAIEGLGRVRSVLDPLRRLNRVLHDDDPAHQRPGDSRAANRQLLLVLRLDEATQPDLWVDAAEQRVRLSVEADPVAKSRRIAIVEQVEAELAAALPAGWSFRLTGPFALYLDLVREMQETQIGSFASSSLAIALLFWLFLWITGSPVRSALWWAFVGMIPNLLPVVATLGAMGLWGIPLDVGTIMVGAIVLGIAVDDTIHFITHYRSARNAGAAPREAIATTMRRTGRAIVTTSFALALGFFALTLSSWQSIASFGLLSGIAILAALAADLLLLPALILGLSSPSAGPERLQVSRALPRRGRGALALLAVLAAAGTLQAAAAGMARPATPRPACRWLASGHVLPPASFDASCPLGAFERVELLQAGGTSVRPHDERELWRALERGDALRARVTRAGTTAWVSVPLLGGEGPRGIPRLAAAGLSALVLVGLGVFLLAYSSAPAAVPLLVLCTSVSVLVSDALCGALAQLPAWPALLALGIAPAAAAHLGLGFPRPGALLASGPGVVHLLYGGAACVVAILLWGAQEYPALLHAASAACASLAGLVWLLLLLKCAVIARESPVALERARARAAASGTALAASAVAALWLATVTTGAGSALDLAAAAAVALPLPIGYGLARYQLNDVRPHVRQLASYALLHVAWAVAVAMLLAEIFHRRMPKTLGDPAAALGLLALVLLLAVGARDALWRALRRGIPTLGARLRGLEIEIARDLEPLREPETTASFLAEVLAVGLGGSGVACFLRADAGWRLAASFGPLSATAALAEDGLRVCARSGGPTHLAFEGGAEGPWADRLRDAGVELVVPLRREEEVLGIALVGAARDELPYTRQEIAFAGEVAARAEVAIERARLAEDLLRAERLEAVGRVAAGLAHDLGKPLSLVYQRARAMGRESLAPEEVCRHAESIAALADEALAALDRLVEQGRAGRRRDAPAPLADLIARAVQTAERLHGPDRVAVRTTPRLPEVGAARDLHSVLANLLDNALRAGAATPVEVYAVANEGEVVIEVIDHGLGMDEATLRRAFRPFFTTRSRQGGRGIGLAASQALVAQLGGMLELDSAPGRGTRARIRLPVRRPEDAGGRA